MVHLLVVNTGNQPASFPFEDFRLLDGDGRTFTNHEAGFALRIEDGPPDYEELQPGVEYLTLIVFEIPKDAAGLTLRIKSVERGGLRRPARSVIPHRCQRSLHGTARRSVPAQSAGATDALSATPTPPNAMQITADTTVGAIRDALAATIARADDTAATAQQGAALAMHAPDDTADDRWIRTTRRPPSMIAPTPSAPRPERRRRGWRSRRRLPTWARRSPDHDDGAWIAVPCEVTLTLIWRPLRCAQFPTRPRLCSTVPTT